MSGVINTIWELPADEKFDGIRPFNPFKVKLEAVAGQWGLKGYLNGDIPKPHVETPTTAASGSNEPARIPMPGTPPPPTLSYSRNPSLEEWLYRDEKVKSTILMNVEDLHSLVDDVSTKSSAQIWEELTNTYIRRDEMRKTFADSAFKNLRFAPNSGQTLAEFLKTLKVKRKEAMDYGNQYTDQDFRSVIASSLPGKEFDTMLQAMAGIKAPADLIQQIELFYARVEERDSKVAGSSKQLLTADATMATIQALQARIAQLETGKRKKKEDKTCTNCKKKGHLAEDCFRDGGGKAGQWPDWWQGKRDGSNPGGGSAGANAASNMAVSSLSQHYALSAYTTVDNDLLAGSAPNDGLDLGGNPWDDPEDPILEVGTAKWSEDSFEEIWAGTSLKWEGISLDERIRILNATIGMIEIKELILTVLDSGATDHFVTNRESFETYEPIEPTQGSGSKKGSKFSIIGKGRAKKTFIVDGEERTITFDALHTPDVSSDLISVSQLDGKGLSVVFSQGSGRVYDQNHKLIMSATKKNGLYVFEVKPGGPEALAARSLNKPVTMDMWHRRYGHASMDRIRRSFAKQLVDGGSVSAESNGVKCVPCLHGKGVRRPFDAEVVPTSKPLARVHTDLCGPMRVTGRGGFLYSMPIVDDGTSFTKQYYLKDKTATTTLKAMEGFRVEAERQTGEKLKVVRVDGGGEFDNTLWEAWGIKHGIIIEIIPPYSSAANGVAERRHRSIYERVRTILHDSKLPTSLWCWAASYVVYTDNLLPSSRHPDLIPAEAFHGKRQSVTHLRPFGCRGFAKIVDGKPGKLDDQVFEGRMVGYDERGVYWLYLNDGRIVRSRDVVFDESQSSSATTIHSTEVEDVVDLLPDNVADGVQPEANLPAAPSFDRDRDPQRPLSNNADTLLPTVPVPQVDARPARRTRTVVNVEPTRRSSRLNPLPGEKARALSRAAIESEEYKKREAAAEDDGDPWSTDVPAKEHLETQAKMTLAETNPFDFLPESVNYLDASDNIALAAVGLPPVPKNYAQAMEDPDRWRPAMDEEMSRMAAYEVFGPACVPPKNASVLNVMWVYAHKFNGEGEIIGEKARLVVQGQHQVEGRDYYKKYAGVMRLESLRMLLATWVTLGFYIWQVDFKSAYLNAKMDEELYVRLPHGFQGANSPAVIVPLLKSLYGAVQAGHNWWQELDGAYKDLGYKRSEADQCVRSRRDKRGETHTGTYTDDTAGGSSSLEEAERAKKELGERYAIKVTDQVEFSLGMKLEHDREKGIASLSMRGYLERLLERHGFSDMKSKSTPFALGTVLSKEGAPVTDAQREFMRDKPYDVIVGGLQFAVGAMRPDLAYSVNVLSRYTRDPGPSHWKALVHVLGYVKGTLDVGITYRRDVKDGMIPVTYVDADLGKCPDTGRSTMGILTKMAGAPTFWMSKRLDITSMSTVETEYIALSRGSQQAIWTYSFMAELGYPQPLPMQLYNDNKGALTVLENPTYHARTKYIGLRHHRIRELVNPGARGVKQLSVQYVTSEENPADVLTKSLSTAVHARQLELMGISRSVA